MSGPKVVRIVTREEVLSICEGLLARVETALEEWVRVGRRNGCVNDEEVTDSRARLQSLRKLMAADRFLDVQKRAPLEVVALQEDMQGRLTQIAVEASAQRHKIRRRAEATATLLKALAAKGKSVSPELEKRLGAAEQDTVAKAMAEAFGLLADTSQGTLNQKRALAARLKDEQVQMSLEEWMAAQPASPADAAFLRLERQISELAARGSDRQAAFEDRLQQAVRESEPRRGLLVDSLHVDLSHELASRKEVVRLDQEVALSLAELKALGGGEGNAFGPGSGSTTDRQAQLVAIRAAIEVHRGRMAAEARRAAILKSLAGLGYEVTEGLQTAWVQNGRVVVRKAVPPGYGVEISGTADLDRMQVRVVAFDGEAPVDVARDRDAETLWCGDVDKLERSLARDGGSLVIERALAVGASPVKRVAVPMSENSSEAHKGHPAHLRSLK